MSGIATRAWGWAAETTLSVACRTAGAASRVVSRAAISVAELPVTQRAVAAGSEAVSTIASRVAASPATSQFATTVAQASGKFVQTATQVDHAAIETARGAMTLQLVDRLVTAEAHNAVLTRQLFALGHTPLSAPVISTAGRVAAGAANATAAVSVTARSGAVAVEAAASAPAATGIAGRLRNAVSALNPLK